jgi:hypothetical protein
MLPVHVIASCVIAVFDFCCILSIFFVYLVCANRRILLWVFLLFFFCTFVNVLALLNVIFCDICVDFLFHLNSIKNMILICSMFMKTASLEGSSYMHCYDHPSSSSSIIHVHTQSIFDQRIYIYLQVYILTQA